MSIVNVSDQLFRRTYDVAIAQGKSVDEFVAETLEQVVASVPATAVVVERKTRNRLPVMVVGGEVPRIDQAKVRAAIEEEGF